MKIPSSRVLAGSILALLSPTVSAQLYVAQFNGLTGTSMQLGEDSNRTLPITASGLYDLADFIDPQSSQPGAFSINNFIPGNTDADDNDYSLLASGFLHVATTGTYRFTSFTDDQSRIVLDGRNVNVQGGCCGTVTGPGIFLEAGSTHFIQMTYREGGGGSYGEWSVSRDNGGIFLLGTGPSAHPDLNINQTGFTLAGARGGDLGLLGAYYQTPGLVNQNRDTDTFLAGSPAPVGTFLSSTIDYHGGDRTIEAHLGADAATLTGGGSNSTADSLFTFRGFIEIRPEDDIDLATAGIQVKFVLGADDNARLRIGGLTIMENDGGHGFPHFVSGNVDTLASGTGDNAGGTALVSFQLGGLYALEAYYHNGAGGADGQLFSTIGLTEGGVYSGNVQTVPSTRLFNTTLPPDGANKFWSPGSLTGLWDMNTTPNWRNTNDAGPGDAVFSVDDKAIFGNLGPAGARTVTVAPGGVVPGEIIVNNAAGNDYTIGGGGVIRGFAPLTKDGVGSLTMVGDNEFLGSTVIKHGTVNVTTIGDPSTAGNLGKGTRITLGDTAGASDAVLNYTGATASVNRELHIDTTGGQIQIPNAGTTLTITNNFTGSGILTKAGPGALVLSGAGGLGFSGGLNIAQGSLSVARLGAAAEGAGINIGGGSSFIYTGQNAINGRGLTVGAGGGTISIPSAVTRLQLTGPTTANSTLTIAGPGRLALAGPVNFSSLPTIAPGATLALQNEDGTNVLPTGSIQLTTGQTLEVAPNALGNNTAPITLAGGRLRLGHDGLLGEYYSGSVGNTNNRVPALSGTVVSVNNFFDARQPAVVARTTTGGQTNLNFSNGNGGPGAPFENQGFADVDNLSARFSGKILITEPGLTSFHTTSDDGSAIFINGQRVVDNNFYQGMTERSGQITLPAGLHDIVIYFYEGGGGAGLIAQMTPPGGVKQPISNAILYAADVYDDSNRGVVVTQSSALEIASARANLGTLTLEGGQTLALTGSATFAGTTRTGTGALEINNRIGNLNLGTISAGANPTINKAGNGALVFSAAPPAGTTINVAGGLVVTQGSGEAGSTIDPLANATINLTDGTGIGYSATSGNPVYTKPISATGSYRIEAGRFDGGLLDPTTVTVQPANLTVSAGNTLSTRVLNDNFTLNIAAPISGAGTVVAEEGRINFTGSSVSPGAFTVHIANATVAAPLTTGALTVTNNLNGVVPIGTGNDNSLSGRLTTQSTVNASSVTVNGGRLTAQGAFTNTGALTTTGGTVVFEQNSSHGSVAMSGGTVTAAAATTFSSSGPVSVTGGTLRLNGTASASSLAASGTGTIAIGGDTTSTNGTAVNNGGTLLFDHFGEVTFGSPVNVAGGTVRAASGTTDLGSRAITVTPLMYQAGLIEGLISNTTSVNTATANPGTGRPGTDTGGIRLSPRMGLTNRVDRPGTNYWSDNETWVYTGQFFDADGIFSFAEHIDDQVRVRVDGVQVLSNDNWDIPTTTGTRDFGMGPAGDGWHTVEFRFMNGGGGAGTVANTGWGGGNNDLYTNKGFGLAVNGSDSTNGADYIMPIDPGDASLFRTAAAGTGGSVVVAAGAILKAGSITGAEQLRIDGAARFEINNNTGNTSSNVNTLRSGPPPGEFGFGDATLRVGSNNTLTVGTLQAGVPLIKEGPGTVIVTGVVAGGAAGSLAPSDIRGNAVRITDGTFIVNSRVQTTHIPEFGEIPGTVEATGTNTRIGGVGTLDGVLTVTDNATLAPGHNGIGTFTSGSLKLQNGAKLELELTSNVLHDILVVNGAVDLANTTLLTSFLSLSGAPGDRFFILRNDANDPINGTFVGLPNRQTFGSGEITFRIHYDANFETDALLGGNDIALELVTIPEPGTFAALLGGTALLLGIRRRRAGA